MELNAFIEYICLTRGPWSWMLLESISAYREEHAVEWFWRVYMLTSRTMELNAFGEYIYAYLKDHGVERLWRVYLPSDGQNRAGFACSRRSVKQQVRKPILFHKLSDWNINILHNNSNWDNNIYLEYPPHMKTLIYMSNNTHKVIDLMTHPKSTKVLCHTQNTKWASIRVN